MHVHFVRQTLISLFNFFPALGAITNKFLISCHGYQLVYEAINLHQYNGYDVMFTSSYDLTVLYPM